VDTITVVVIKRNIRSVAKRRRSVVRATIITNTVVLAAINTPTTRATAAATAVVAVVMVVMVVMENRVCITKSSLIQS